MNSPLLPRRLGRWPRERSPRNPARPHRPVQTCHPNPAQSFAAWRCGLVGHHGLVSANRISMKFYEVSAMTPVAVDLSQVDSTVRAQVLQTLSASGLSEQLFLGHLYRLFGQGQFSLLDLLGPNAESLAAIQELEEGRGVISASVDDLFADLHAID